MARDGRAIHEYGTNTRMLSHLAPPIRAFVRQFVDSCAPDYNMKPLCPAIQAGMGGID
jgi:hypothetical protein